MRIRSTELTRFHIRDAVNSTPDLDFIWFGEYGDTLIREWTPRISSGYTHGFEFFLTGSSSRASAHNPNHPSASWSAWGIMIDKLYQIDPNAEIGYYRNRDHFMSETRRQAPIRGEDAPWLS